MALPWHKCVITDIQPESEQTWKFYFEVPEMDEFDFTPGQFITFDLPIADKPAKRMRSYSIASPPNGSNKFELVIVLVEGGLGTTYLFNKAKVGTEIPFRGPLGKFVLPEKIERDICFVCTGTGIAPFRSMLHYVKAHNVPTKNIYLLFGSRLISDVLYYKEMQQLAEELDALEYIVTLSRETSPEWKGGKGYVHAIYEELFADKRPADFYLCGWTNMIKEARSRLEEMGYDRKDIHMEIYG